MEDDKVTIHSVKDQHGVVFHLTPVGGEKTFCGLDASEAKGVHYEYSEYIADLPTGTYCTACHIAASWRRIRLERVSKWVRK